ncbi:ImmA/IrrE family metallo-endopeptidase [Sporolactobacillus shoreicorticis]|uniref:ImmA/IrrE family metallo-endopeptidase n=1 Tax=Sporolactobacillus shoreicorticis TaxID=1923877 RepID=A0ABW5S5D0_9BACL|nr:ImmA/IrrE family metallo-endopeptidase [Sporolactobacillus shoreicorticis]MCO7127757.1 ImmA/IrrE family metallo-endopeptidase [Sporolactobacillus shoreicorticis]
MDFPYTPTPFERWVSDTLINAGILSPSDICAEKICSAFGIEYTAHFGIAGSKTTDDGSYIVTDKRLHRPEQHEQFMHELGHVLRHYGDQTNMPDMFRKYQECDAEVFAMYAAIPLHMIDFSRPYSYQSLANEFNVTPRLALKRIENITQKIIWEQNQQQMICEPKAVPYDISQKSAETQRIMNQLKSQLQQKGESYEFKSLL